jgi:hypothetical protein
MLDILSAHIEHRFDFDRVARLIGGGIIAPDLCMHKPRAVAHVSHDGTPDTFTLSGESK